MLGLIGPVAAAQAGDPPGNNGTVKVDGIVFDVHPDNEPHVGCVFEVDLYGFDAGDLDATVTFTGVAPTGGGELLTDTVPIGEDAASGGTDLDASESYDLTEALADVEPHPEQGFHVRLTIHAEGSQGADTKFKEFWVSGCSAPPGSTTSSTSTSSSSTTTTTPSDATTTTSSGHPGSSTTVPRDGGRPEGPQPGAPGPGGSTTVVTPGVGALAETGSNVGPLLATALVLGGLGAAAVVGAKRMRAREAE